MAENAAGLSTDLSTEALPEVEVAATAGGPFSRPVKRPIEGLGHDELRAWLTVHKEPAFRANQIRRWLFQQRVTAFDQMTNLAKPLRTALNAEFSIGSVSLHRSTESKDGTLKYLFRLADGYTIETVFIPDSQRVTLCVSTQVGCGLGCGFCATARMGLRRNLTQAEILDQILESQRRSPAGRRISNLVFMGMGEPLANYVATRDAITTITDADSGLGISPRKITVSTVGLVPQIQRLMAETNVNLAISLHAVSDTLRSALMPINRKYALAELFACCESLPIPRRKRITFEYLVIRGLNHYPADAKALGARLRRIRCKINLIPFNPHEGSSYASPHEDDVERFSEALRSQGLHVSVRRPRGDDIQAACGQLYNAEPRAAHVMGRLSK